MTNMWSNQITDQQLRWREPWFFSLRMRDLSGWKRKGWLIVAMFVAMMVGCCLDQRYGKVLRFGLNGAILLCLGIAVFVGFLNDLSVSEVQASDEGLARAVYGHGVGAAFTVTRICSAFSSFHPENAVRNSACWFLRCVRGMWCSGFRIICPRVS